MNFCPTCGAEVWELKGSDVLTCRRGHHWPIVVESVNALKAELMATYERHCGKNDESPADHKG